MKTTWLWTIVFAFAAIGLYAQEEKVLSEEDILVNLNANQGHRNLLEIRQVGELNELQVTQTGRQRTLATQEGVNNEADIKLLGGQNNSVNLGQNGINNRLTFTIDIGFDNNFSILQRNADNRIDSRFGYAEGVKMEIIQNGGNNLTIDVSNPANLDSPLPSRIEQSTPNAPDIFISDSRNIGPMGIIQTNSP